MFSLRPSPNRLLHSLEPLEPRDLLSSIPLLHSYPAADRVAYLDFDGHVVTETSWNNEFETIHAPAFDVNGDAATFSEEEISRIISIWERIAEDYRPFNIDITTEDPSTRQPDIFTVGGQAQRILFSTKSDDGPDGSGQEWFHQAGTGAAVDSWTYQFDNPVWVFVNEPELAGEIGSHELGHAFGLDHDGFVDGLERVEYRGSHGSGETRWSPIMGAGSGLSQWSQGEYTDPTNHENDIGLIAQAIGMRKDDHPGITPFIMNNDQDLFQEGVIHERSDEDIFSFMVTEPDRLVSIAAEPWHNGANLDIGLSLWGPSTTRFTSTDETVNPPDKLSASFEMSLEPGTYFLTVDGVAKQSVPGDQGYSDYGSLGYYKLSGRIAAATGLRGDIDQDGELSAADIDALYALAQGDGALGPGDGGADLNGDRAIDWRDVDVLVQDVLGTEYGDFDLDGDVDFDDFLVLAANFGSRESIGWAQGDATGDDEVSFDDFLLLAAAFSFEAHA